MRINVTAEDIKQGERDDYTGCPVALAVKRVFPLFSVGIVVYSADIGGKHVALPLHVTHFIEAFDKGRPVEPFEFDLDYTAAEHPKS